MADNRKPLPKFLKLQLTSQLIAIGERIKKGTFRPCIETIPTSTMMGCLREHFGLYNVVSIGFFKSGTYLKQLFTYAPFDAALGTAKLPLSVQYLVPKGDNGEIIAEIYIEATKETRCIFVNRVHHIVTLGALRSKGFGHCNLNFEAEVQPERRVGYLRGNLRETDASAFGIDPQHDLVKPRYGYLFRPDAYYIGGKYERALFIGTILEGPDFLIGEEYLYD
jgi:hypothetical protein